MISSVRGAVLAIGTGHAIIEVGGVGFYVHATPDTLSRLHIGEEARLATTLVVREESMTLFGFGSEDERNVFEILTGVTGVGPKTALTVLSVHTPDELRTAVHTKNEAALTRVPGIGKKGAQRMILEIGTKLGPAAGVQSASEQPASAPSNADVLEALTNLGWKEAEAAAAVEEAETEIPNGTVAQLLRASLQILGQRR